MTVSQIVITSISCCRWTRATRCLTRITLYAEVDAQCENKKGSPYSITERRVPELIPLLGSQPGGDASHKPGGRLPLLSARPAVTLAVIKMAASNFAAISW